MKRFLLLLAMIVVSGVLFTGMVSAATVGSDSFDIMNASSVVQTGPDSMKIAPVNGMASLVAAPGSSFFEQNGQMYYQTPTDIYQLGVAGAQTCKVSSIRVDIYGNGPITVTVTSNRPFDMRVEKIPGGWRVTITPK